MTESTRKPPPDPEMVQVRRDELKQLYEEYKELCTVLTEASTRRIDAEMGKLRLERWLGISDPDKTPVRPPSVSDMKRAFDNSSNFSPRTGVTRPGGTRVQGLPKADPEKDR